MESSRFRSFASSKMQNHNVNVEVGVLLKLKKSNRMAKIDKNKRSKDAHTVTGTHSESILFVHNIRSRWCFVAVIGVYFESFFLSIASFAHSLCVFSGGMQTLLAKTAES